MRQGRSVSRTRETRRGRSLPVHRQLPRVRRAAILPWQRAGATATQWPPPQSYRARRALRNSRPSLRRCGRIGRRRAAKPRAWRQDRRYRRRRAPRPDAESAETRDEQFDCTIGTTTTPSGCADQVGGMPPSTAAIRADGTECRCRRPVLARSPWRTRRTAAHRRNRTRWSAVRFVPGAAEQPSLRDRGDRRDGKTRRPTRADWRRGRRLR